MFRVNCWFCLQALCRGSLISWGFFSPNGAALDHIRSLCQSGMVCIFCFQIIRPMGACYMNDLFNSTQILGKKDTAESVHKTVKVIPQYCIAHPFCAQFLRHQRVHVCNERNFPQAKLDSEINARFLLNGHGDLYFLFNDNSVHTTLFNLKEN